ncbi:DENN domain-containing protein [Phytophthora infestans]|uniref:DENN (AEX-3) domain-containing protein n=1 Tax=Phytophthora infestans TaxID=4787 RepID=A0A833T3T8_PHYIN|nr:DENN domain-containing protein [Phytophthora infestans]KAF4144215.1 DENN (AEX-3) domain-containing protein [Phytophthora infestans]
MELTLEAVAKDAFRRDFFLRCFTEREAQALELRFAFLLRVRQYKRLVGRRDLLPRAAKDIVTAYLQQVQSTDQLLLPPSAEPLRTRVLNAAAAGHCPLDLFNGLETLVRDHMTRTAFPQFLSSPDYTALCGALRSRRELPLAEVLVDSRRTQFLMKYITDKFPGDEGNLHFWVHVQTRFLPLIQTTLFSVALFEEVQRHVRHVFNRFLVGETETGEGAGHAATRVSETVRRATLQQIMKLQSEPFSPPRYANLFRTAQDCVWEWLQTEVHPKFRASSLYVMLVVETEDLETDQQLRRLSEHVQATAKRSATMRQSETVLRVSSRKSETQAKANAVLVPIKQSSPQNLWGQGDGGNRRSFDRVLVVQELAQFGIYSISVASMVTLRTNADDCDVVFELFCTGDQQEAALETHPAHVNFWRKNVAIASSGSALSPSGCPLSPTVPKPSFHDFVLPKDEIRGCGEPVSARYLFGVCLTLWRQREKPITGATSPLDAKLSATAQPCPQVLIVLTTEPMHKNSRRLLLKLASSDLNDMTVDDISRLVKSIYESSSGDQPLLSARYGGFNLQPNLRKIDMSLSAVFKEICSQTFISILSSILVGKSIILVSERASALISVAEAARELLKPFEWMHFYLPFCPVATCSELRDAGLFSEVNTSPFRIGCEGMLTYQKKDSGSEQRFRIRDSIYTTHRVSLHLQALGPIEYPPELLQTTAIIVDIDSDDIYVPEKVEIPELPQSTLRSLESMLNTALHSSRITQADSHLFGPSKTPSFTQEMLGQSIKNSQSEEPSAEITSAELESVDLSLDDRARLALLWFLEALFGDVVYYFCSLHQNFAVETQSTSADTDEFLLFEVDSYLDAHIELGCRDFFRQCFHSELFRNFMLAQHMQFALTAVDESLESSESPVQLETQLEALSDGFI